ncbi:MAG: DUF692 domain-containing protein [Gaiellaceae bacterium]
MSPWGDGELRIGIGWREPIAGFIAAQEELGFVEVVAESLPANGSLPAAIEQLLDRGVVAVPHGLRLSLGGAERPDPARVAHLGHASAALGSPLVSEHIAFVRAGGRSAGHLMPVPRTRAALDVVVENVRIAINALPVPLALEHVAALVEWPESEMTEADFVSEVIERTGADLVLDVANLYANSRNHGFDPLEFLDRIPLERVAYVHVGGGVEREGVYHDTHRHPVVTDVLGLLEELCARTLPPAILLERDDDFPAPEALAAELAAIRAAAERGRRRTSTRVG